MGNCYAYACKRDVVNAQYIPGSYAGSKVEPAAREQKLDKKGQPVPPKKKEVQAYTDALVEGVIADMEGNNISTGAARISRKIKVMPQIPANHYVIALVAKIDGFHFCRRGDDGLWSWKMGPSGVFTDKCFDIRRKAYVQSDIDDALMKKILQNGKVFPQFGPPWLFGAYFVLPDDGMNVAA